LPDIHADVGNHYEVTMRNRIFEVTGILSQNSCILFDIDGIWQEYDCSSNASEAGFQVINIHNEMELRYEHEKKLMHNNEDRILLIMHQLDMYIPVDIRRLFTITMLTYDRLFPQLSAEALRSMQGIDMDLLAYSMSKIPFGFMDYAQTIDWCQRGMYQAENCVEYASGLLEQALVLCKTASKHRDWDTIAKLYGKAAMIQHSGVSLANWTQARKLIEESFGTWVDQKYHLLSGSVDRKRPVLLSKVADFIRRSSSKVALVVMDGMSFENLYTIQREMVNQPIYFEIHSSFSFFPTVTSVARQSIFSGKMPSEHPTPFSLDREEKQWIAFWKSAGLRDNEIFYHKGMLDDVPFTAKALGIVVNIVDDLMHAELQGLSGIQQGLREWIKNGKLSKMFQMLMDNGFTVYMTSDHGNTAAIAEGRFAKPSVVAEPASRRAVIYDASFDARELEKFNVKRYSGAYLPEGYDAYLFSTDTCYGDTGKEYITHGGMTLEEAVVPFVRIGGKHG